jgi:hypothetical protein
MKWLKNVTNLQNFYYFWKNEYHSLTDGKLFLEDDGEKH